MKKQISFLFLILSFITLSSCEQEVIVKKHYKTHTVQTGSINTNTSYSSFTQGITETLLSPKSGGNILFLGKEKGDRVTEGEKLADLDSTEATQGYQTSKDIIDSLTSLKKSTALSYDAQIEAKQETLKKAEEVVKGISIGKENTINTNSSETEIYENKLKTSEINLKMIEKNLTQTKNVLDGKKEKIYKNATASITQALILDTSIINFVDELLGITPENRDKNNKFEDYLSAKNHEYLGEATQLFKETNNSYLEYKNFYETYVENKNISDEKIIEGLQQGETLAGNFKELLKSTSEVLSYSVENIYLTQNELNGYKQIVYEYGNSIEASIITISGEYSIGLKGSQDSIDLFERNSQKELVLLEEQVLLGEKQVEIAKDDLEKMNYIITGNIDEINNQKDIGNINITEIGASIKSLEKEKLSKLQEINIQINQVLGNKNIENIQINNSQIISPFAGIITKKFFEIGTIITGGTPVYKLVNDDEIKLKVNINLSLIPTIKVGDSLYIEIEGSGNNFSGIISNIPHTQEIESKNTQIEIIIDNKNHEIILGTTAKVYIGNNSKEGIIIPNKAIISDFMIPSVMTIKNNKTELKNIKIIKQNDNFSLIEGIQAGELIITEGQENIWDDEELN